MKTAIVCGGRDYSDRERLFSFMDELQVKYAFTEIMQGGARGAYAIAKEWALARGLESTTVPAEWETHGKSAGPLRNKKMLRMRPDAVVVVFPGGRGTSHMATLSTLRDGESETIFDLQTPR